MSDTICRIQGNLVVISLGIRFREMIKRNRHCELPGTVTKRAPAERQALEAM